MTVLLPLLLTVLLGAPPQQPRDGARPAATGSSHISGTVISDDRSPQPIRRAIVTIADASGVNRSTITDDNGRFTFERLPAGRFSVKASRKAYLPSEYGAAYPGGPGTRITLAEGASADDLRITMPKGAVLTGIITDMNGAPVPTLEVTVFRETTSRYEAAGSGRTDDRGVYRVYGLPPGEYLIAVAPRTTGTGDIAVRSEREIDALLSALERRGSTSTVAPRPGETADNVSFAASSQRYGFAQFYYPGTAVAAEAARVTVSAGEVRSGLDFTLGVVPTATISGTVVGSDGRPARDIQITMVPVGPPVTLVLGSGATGPARTAADGSFTRGSVTPGAYRLLARRTPAVSGAAPLITSRGGPTEWAMTDIVVNGEDIQGLSLTLQPGLRVTGRIVFEGTSEIPANLSAIRVGFTPATPAERTGNVATTPAKADGTVEIASLLPGSYYVGLSLPPEVAKQWWPRSAASGGRDLLDVPLELAPGVTPEVVFTLTDRRPSLAGVVEDASGRATAHATVVAFSTDRAQWRRESRRVRVARPGTDGRYEIADMPPGEYFVAAVQMMHADAGHQPVFLERLAAQAVRVAIAEGEQKTQTVRVGVTR